MTGDAPDETLTLATDGAPPAERARGSGHGPGFALGILAGVVAGAAAATLLSHPTEDDHSAPRAGTGPETPLERALALLEALRLRLQEAREEGRKAAHEAEEEMRRRFEQLTGQQV